MFDIGFWELCLIAVIALLVFGPEKLPGIARNAGLWIGKARRFITTVKQDVDRELHLQEIQENIKQSDQNGLHQFIEETKTGLSELNKPINIDPLQSTENKEDLSSSTSSPDSSHKTENSHKTETR
ncbi:MAG: twin-arginine translocase subunit TatB [Thiomargarita sp.]|nr:twin-arginine translocase subunit TatB [Thiomargarita sp.]